MDGAEEKFRAEHAERLKLKAEELHRFFAARVCSPSSEEIEADVAPRERQKRGG